MQFIDASSQSSVDELRNGENQCEKAVGDNYCFEEQVS
jgi:hypothetical protein